MPKPPNPNALPCPICQRPMQSRGGRWRCPEPHKARGEKPPPLSGAERVRRHRARKASRTPPLDTCEEVGYNRAEYDPR